MYTLSGRGMQVGRGENRSLGFYGVGKLAADVSLADSVSSSGGDMTVVSEDSSTQAAANAYINSGGGDSSARVDPNTGLALYVRSYSNPNPVPVPASSNNTTMIMLAAAVVVLVIGLKR